MSVEKDIERILTLQERILDVVNDTLRMEKRFVPTSFRTWRTLLVNTSNFGYGDFMIQTDVDQRGMWLRLLDPLEAPVWSKRFTWEIVEEI